MLDHLHIANIAMCIDVRFVGLGTGSDPARS